MQSQNLANNYKKDLQIGDFENFSALNNNKIQIEDGTNEIEYMEKQNSERLSRQSFNHEIQPQDEPQPKGVNLLTKVFTELKNEQKTEENPTSNALKNFLANVKSTKKAKPDEKSREKSINRTSLKSVGKALLKKGTSVEKNNSPVEIVNTMKPKYEKKPALLMGSDASMNRPALPPTHAKVSNSALENAKKRSNYSSYLKNNKKKGEKATIAGAIFLLTKSGTKRESSIKEISTSDFHNSGVNQSSKLNMSMNSQGSYTDRNTKKKSRREEKDFPRVSTKSIDSRKSIESKNLSQSQISHHSSTRKSVDNDNQYFKKHFIKSQKSIQSQEKKGYGDIHKAKKVYKESSQRSVSRYSESHCN